MKRVLIVEDEKSLQTIIKYDLEQLGYIVDVCDDGNEAIELIIKNQYDFVLLDLMLPGKTGIEICKIVRDKSYQGYIILLTAVFDEISKLEAFATGADDYVTKPFSMREVVARMNAGEKRMVNKKVLYNYLHLSIDNSNHTIKLNGDIIELTYLEFELIKFFIVNEGVVLSRETLLEKVWGYDYIGETRVVDIYVHKLREKLNLNDCIKTVRSVGYLLVEQK